MVPYVSLLQYVPQQDAASPRESRKLYLPYVGKNMCLMEFQHAGNHIFMIKVGRMGPFRLPSTLRRTSTLICTAYFQKGGNG